MCEICVVVVEEEQKEKIALTGGSFTKEYLRIVPIVPVTREPRGSTTIHLVCAVPYRRDSPLCPGTYSASEKLEKQTNRHDLYGRNV